MTTGERTFADIYGLEAGEIIFGAFPVNTIPATRRETVIITCFGEVRFVTGVDNAVTMATALRQHPKVESVRTLPSQTLRGVFINNFETLIVRVRKEDGI